MTRTPSLTIVVALAALFACRANAQSQPPKSNTLTVATWNLEWFFDEHQGDNFSDLAREQSAPSREAWEWKRNVVATAIARMKPDIIALQEVENQRVLYYLTRQLRASHELRYRIAFVEGHDYYTEQDVGVLYREDVIEVGRWESTSAEYRDKRLSSVNKHMFAKFLVGQEGQRETLTLVNLHFRARAEQAQRRQTQARQLNRWLARLPLAEQANLIVLGDFNTEHRYQQAPAVKPSDLDVLRTRETATPEDDLTDLHQFLDPQQRATHMTGGQFDRMLVGRGLVADAPGRVDLKLESVRVAKEVNVRGGGPDKKHWEETPYWTIADKERDISDHYPLVAVFRLQ